MISSHRSVRWIIRAALVALVALVAACSSSDSNDPSAPPPSVPPQSGPPLTSGTIEVNRSSVMLTAVGQSRQLTVRTMDGSGATVNAAVVWSSSAADQVSVDATGRVVARAIGSAQVYATSGGVRSAPIFIVVAEPQPGALLVTDAQVLSIGQPIDVAPNQVPTIGTRYEVRLSGVTTPPSPGTVVLSTENAPVAGKVVSARIESGTMVVTLTLAPLRELLARYDIDWSINLSDLPARLDLTTPSAAAANAARAISPNPGALRPDANIIQPFTALSCDASLGPVLLDRRVQLAPTATLRLDFVESPTQTRRAVVGSFTLDGSVSLKLNAGFKFTGGCLAQVLFRIPIGGPLALGIMPGVRVGVGVGLDGQIAVTAGELSLTGQYGTQIEIGWECGGVTASCQALDKTTPINTLTPKYEVFNPVTGMRVELSGQVYALIGLDAVLFTAFTIPLVEAKVGPVQSVDLGFEEDQAINPGYASKYDLKLDAVVEPGSGLQAMLDFISPGIRLTFQGKSSQLLSHSPRGLLTVSKPVVGLSGETIDLTVDLTDQNYFLIGYNVERVELWRRKGTDEKFARMRVFNVTASNQTRFMHTWLPTTDDIGINDFAVFVYTKFPVPGLEIADNSVKRVEVKCFTAGPRVRANVAAATNACSDTWEGTAKLFSPGQIEMDAVVTWRRNPAIPEVEGDIHHTASGHVTVKWIDWDNKGCAVSKKVFLIGDPLWDASDLVVRYDETPFGYEGIADILMPVTVTCPGEQPVLHRVASIWFGGMGKVSANGTLISGRQDPGGGVFLEWRFARP